MFTNLLLTRNRCHRAAGSAVTLAAMLVLTLVRPSLAQTQPTDFASAGQAARALYDAVRNGDDKTIQAILAAPQLTSTGNEAEDKLEREGFVKKYQEMHRLVREADGSVVLYVGAENWPFPIPLVATDGKWHFDSDSGSQEVLAREVGENETVAIAVCKALRKEDGGATVKTSSGDPLEFAQKLSKSEPPSTANGPFHGYYFRLLKQQLPGNTLVVAYPAEYGASGVMTFVVRGNVVYEKDLGPQSASVAERIAGKPAGKWNPVQ